METCWECNKDIEGEGRKVEMYGVIVTCHKACAEVLAMRYGEGKYKRVGGTVEIDPNDPLKTIRRTKSG